MRTQKGFKSYKKWTRGCVCEDKKETEGHWDCENNDCDVCCYEYIYERFIEEWNITPPEPEDDDEEVTYPIHYYERVKVVDETSGDLVDRQFYQTDFVSLQAFLDKYLFKHYSFVSLLINMLIF